MADARDVITRALADEMGPKGSWPALERAADLAELALAALHDAGFVVARIDRGMFDAVLSTLVDDSYSCGHGLGSDEEVARGRAELTEMVFGKDQP